MIELSFWHYAFLCYWAFTISAIEWALMKAKPLSNVDEERDSKYPAFRRYDTKYWVRPYLYVGSLFMPIKVLFTATTQMTLLIGMVVCLCKQDRRNVSKLRFKMFNLYLRFICFLNVIFIPIIPRVVRPKVDYKKYFGPDFEEDYETHVPIISNHSSLFDIPLIEYLYCSGWVAKKEIRNVPFIGYMSEIYEVYHIDRVGSKEEKE